MWGTTSSMVFILEDTAACGHTHTETCKLKQKHTRIYQCMHTIPMPLNTHSPTLKYAHTPLLCTPAYSLIHWVIHLHTKHTYQCGCITNIHIYIHAYPHRMRGRGRPQNLSFCHVALPCSGDHIQSSYIPTHWRGPLFCV